MADDASPLQNLIQDYSAAAEFVNAPIMVLIEGKGLKGIADGELPRYVRGELFIAVNNIPGQPRVIAVLPERVIEDLPPGGAEATLFDDCPATVILIEPELDLDGARTELGVHSGQKGFHHKVFILIPEKLHDHAKDGSLFSGIVQTPPESSVFPYTNAEYYGHQLAGPVVGWLQKTRIRQIRGDRLDEWREERERQRTQQVKGRRR